MIDDTLAARAFGSSEAAIGRTLQLERERTPESQFEVIGVVRHIRYHDLRRPLLPQIYQAGLFTQFSVAARASGNAALVARTVETAIATFRPGTAVQDVRLLADVVKEALGPTLLAAALMTTFGVVALLLAAVGVYGVFSYYVAERMSDFAVRLALGASPSEIYRFVLARCVGMAVVGIALGLIGAASLGRVGADALYGVHAWDAGVYVGALACITIVALCAAALPARRASSVDPGRWLTRIS